MTVRGLEITDLHPRGYLAFDLREILLCLGEDALNRVWRCDDLECMGEATPELEAIEASGEFVTGQELLALARRTKQFIWGRFCGRYPDEPEDTLRVESFDSSYWAVFGDERCLAKIRGRFEDVRPVADRAG